MTTNSMIAEMFEEIKDALKSVEEKIASASDDEEKAKVVRENRIRQNKMAVENILQEISDRLESIGRTSSSLRVDIRESEQTIIQAITARQKEQKDQSRLKVRRKTVLWTFIILFSLAAGSITGNVYQFREIKRLEENDLKYRFIKINKGITSEQLNQLDSLYLKKEDLPRASN